MSNQSLMNDNNNNDNKSSEMNNTLNRNESNICENDLNSNSSLSQQQNQNDINKTREINQLMDRNYLIKLVDINHSKLSFVPQVGKSKAWTRFERIFYDNCKTFYVKCKYCDDIIKHIRPFGTGGLLRHKCLNYSNKKRSIDGHNKKSSFICLQMEEKFNLINDSFGQQLMDNSFDNELKTNDKKGFDGQKNKKYLCLENEDKSNLIVESFGQQLISNLGNDQKISSGIELNGNFVIDRNFLVNLVKAGDNRLSFVPQSGKSCVWNRFERIYYDNCETVYVKCRFCDDIQKIR